MQTSELNSTDKWDFRSESIMTGLSETDLQLLTAHKTEKVYRRGEIIYREGAYPAGIFFITKGKVKKYKVDKTGKEQIIQVITTGNLMGYHAVLSENRYPISASALEESLVAFIAKEDFLKALQQSEELNKKLLKTLSTEFAVFANSVSLFMKNSVRERLASRLILLHEIYRADQEEGAPVEINMSRDDLANIVGAARENIVKELTELKESGIIKTKGRKITLKDINRLISISNRK